MVRRSDYRRLQALEVAAQARHLAAQRRAEAQRAAATRPHEPAEHEWQQVLGIADVFVSVGRLPPGPADCVGKYTRPWECTRCDHWCAALRQEDAAFYKPFAEWVGAHAIHSEWLLPEHIIDFLVAAITSTDD